MNNLETGGGQNRAPGVIRVCTLFQQQRLMGQKKAMFKNGEQGLGYYTDMYNR